MTERIGADAYTDAAPAGTSTYVGKGYFGTNTDTSCGVANYTDTEVNSIFPLTNDTTTLKRRIDKLTTAGSTAGQLGTAWAWYLLSPKWNTVLQQAFPTSNAAAPYSDLTTLNSKGQPKLRKIAVLMTDGDYNINYCKGVGSQELRPDAPTSTATRRTASRRPRQPPCARRSRTPRSRCTRWASR